jgi:hypothetical protein
MTMNWSWVLITKKQNLIYIFYKIQIKKGFNNNNNNNNDKNNKERRNNREDRAVQHLHQHPVCIQNFDSKKKKKKNKKMSILHTQLKEV